MVDLDDDGRNPKGISFLAEGEERKTFKKITKDLGDPGQVKRFGLTNNEIASIRKDTRPNSEIAKEYGIHYNTVRNIKGRYTRTHIWGEY